MGLVNEGHVELIYSSHTIWEILEVNKCSSYLQQGNNTARLTAARQEGTFTCMLTRRRRIQCSGLSRAALREKARSKGVPKFGIVSVQVQRKLCFLPLVYIGMRIFH